MENPSLLKIPSVVEIPADSWNMKKGRTWEESIIVDDATMEAMITEGPSFKGGSSFGPNLGELNVEVTNRKSRATNVNPGIARETGKAAGSGGTGSRFQLLVVVMEEVKPMDSVNLNMRKKVMREEAVGYGVEVNVILDSGANGNEVSGVRLSRPILVTKENGVGTTSHVTGREMVKGGYTGLIRSS
ncbi:hypothetical protein V6N12_058554 [Hibiscus sabdariffa]|uniref:Uncharacterized protein n=1 Tax=Hibiscus sabdariffa TaxID=183260 RepID=A0ABR2EUC1_9ROSI